MELNDLCTFENEHYGIHFCEMILNLGPGVQLSEKCKLV